LLATKFQGRLGVPMISATLAEVHRASRGDWKVFVRALPAAISAWLSGRPVMAAVNPFLAAAYIGVPPPVGELLYLTARALDARQVVEFGTSFGISAIYLAAAMRETGGRLIGTEIEPAKVAAARRNLVGAGLQDHADIREGDALQTLTEIEAPIDLVLLDGWKDLYLPVLALLTPKLRRGAVVFADNIHTFRTGLAPYVAHMRAPENGFKSTTLPMGSGVEYSVYLPK
jgi:predicted O-methyltransferase YrrM